MELKTATDMRGSLVAAQPEDGLPFLPRRFFAVYDVPGTRVRGEHAHKQCKQFLVCLQGSCSVMVDDGEKRDEFILDRPDLGLFVPPMVWASQFGYAREAVLLVMASHDYDPDDYIRDYDEFLAVARRASTGGAD